MGPHVYFFLIESLFLLLGGIRNLRKGVERLMGMSLWYKECSVERPGGQNSLLIFSSWLISSLPRAVFLWGVDEILKGSSVKYTCPVNTLSPPYPQFSVGQGMAMPWYDPHTHILHIFRRFPQLTFSPCSLYYMVFVIFFPFSKKEGL